MSLGKAERRVVTAPTSKTECADCRLPNNVHSDRCKLLSEMVVIYRDCLYQVAKIDRWVENTRDGSIGPGEWPAWAMPGLPVETATPVVDQIWRSEAAEWQFASTGVAGGGAAAAITA